MVVSSPTPHHKIERHRGEVAPDTAETDESRTGRDPDALRAPCCTPASPCRGICPDCQRHWNATGQSHCSACCQHFNSDSAFDRHRTADFTCIPVEDFGKPTG